MDTFRHFFRGMIGGSLVLWVSSIGIFSQPAAAVQLADGTVYFNHPPRLLGARTTEKNVRALGSKYYFTLSVPADAGESLQRVTIAQRESPDDLRFDLEDTLAFIDEDRDQQVALGEVTSNKGRSVVSVTFNPPIPPGKTVTVRLEPRRNPDIGGVYLFGVTAFPQGEKSRGQFLGFGRLHFYNSNDGSSFLFGR